MYSSYIQYETLGDDYLAHYGRKFGYSDPGDPKYHKSYMKDKRNSDLLPFYWTTNSSHSFDSYLNCLAHWEEIADKNRSVDLYEIFRFDRLELLSGENEEPSKHLEIG